MSGYFNLSNMGNFSRISGIGKNVAKEGSVIFSSAKFAAILFTVVFVFVSVDGRRITLTTLQSMMNVKLSQHCHENGPAINDSNNTQ